MTIKNELVLVYTGGKVVIERIVAELEIKGISSFVQDGFQQGIEAGFVGGTPSAIDLFVVESDVRNALEIINAITE